MKLAAELALKTLCSFKSNCAEFINPFDGSGQGVEKYAWTASQFIELIVEVIFGVSYNATKKRNRDFTKTSSRPEKLFFGFKRFEIDPATGIDIHIENGNVRAKFRMKTLKLD